jgi:flagellar basal body rod protein FlgG
LANVSSDGFSRRVATVALTPAGLQVTSRIDAAQGPLRRTGRALDVAVAGGGRFLVRDAAGATFAVRSASLERNAYGQLCDARGRVVVGERGPIVARADASIDEAGAVREGGEQVGRIRMPAGTVLQSGFVEGSNVDAVREMVAVLGAQRSFETAQKTLSALDETHGKDANDVARVKS